MLNFKMTSVVTLLGAAALTFTAQAQSPPPPLVQVVRVTVKPERAAEWREISKRFSEAHKKGGGSFRHVLRSAGNPFEYSILTPMENYAQRDSPGPASKGMSAAEATGLRARRRLCVQEVKITIRRPIPELTIPWTSEEPPKMFTTLTSHVRPGMGDEYIEHRKELFAAYKKAGRPAFGVHRVRWGGSRTTFVSWAPLDKMADLDGENWLVKSMSAEARSKWLEKVLPMLESPSEWRIWVYERELSFRPEQ